MIEISLGSSKILMCLIWNRKLKLDSHRYRCRRDHHLRYNQSKYSVKVENCSRAQYKTLSPQN